MAKKKGVSQRRVPQNDFTRIAQLCYMLQQYHDSVRTWWTEARRAKYEAIRADRNGTLKVHELRGAVELFGKKDKDLNANEVAWLDELINLLRTYKLLSLIPSLDESRKWHKPPHEIEEFDWQAFDRELLAVRDAALCPKWSPPGTIRNWIAWFKDADHRISEDTIERRIRSGEFTAKQPREKGRLILDIKKLPAAMQADEFWNAIRTPQT